MLDLLRDAVTRRLIRERGAAPADLAGGVYLAVIVHSGGSWVKPVTVKWETFYDKAEAIEWVRVEGPKVGRMRVSYILFLRADIEIGGTVVHRAGYVTVVPSTLKDGIERFSGMDQVQNELFDRDRVKHGAADDPDAISLAELAASRAEAYLSMRGVASPMSFGNSDPSDPLAPPPTDQPHWSPAYIVNGPVMTAATGIIGTTQTDLATVGEDIHDTAGPHGKGVLVAVLDTGFAASQRHLFGSRIAGVSTVPGVAWDQGEELHGTWCAGAVGGLLRGDDGLVRYRGHATNVSILFIRVLTPAGWGTDDMISRGLLAAKAAGAQVVSMSIGGPDSLPKTEDAIRQCLGAGMAIIAAAGNSGPGSDTIDYPGRSDGVITVGATGSGPLPVMVANFSARGASMDCVAPGVNTTGPGGRGVFYNLSGTSMATPRVAGIVARAISELAPGWNPTNLTTHATGALWDGCRASAVVPNGTHDRGQGLISTADYAGALAKLLVPTPPPPPPPDGDTVATISKTELAALLTALDVSREIADVLIGSGRVVVRVDPTGIVGAASKQAIQFAEQWRMNVESQRARVTDAIRADRLTPPEGAPADTADDAPPLRIAPESSPTDDRLKVFHPSEPRPM